MNLDPKTRAAIAAFRAGVERLYGDRLEAVVLFGSRARGDAREDSDVDLAVVLRGDVPSPYRETARIVDATYGPTMETGRVVQAVVLSGAQMAQENTLFMKALRQEGVRL